MKKINKLLISFIAAILISTLILIIFWYSQINNEDIETVVIKKNANQIYEAKLITSYDEYQDILKEYEILGKLTYRDFEEHDYILDFLDYSKNTTITGIDIVISENIILTYELSNAEKSDNQILLNLIPIQKDMVSKNSNIKHEIK